jgi:hypothetical protein
MSKARVATTYRQTRRNETFRTGVNGEKPTKTWETLRRLNIVYDEPAPTRENRSRHHENREEASV